MRLLEPVGRGVRLTPQAEILVGHADAVLERLEQAEASLASSLTDITGTLHVAAFQTAALSLIPPTLSACRTTPPTPDRDDRDGARGIPSWVDRPPLRPSARPRTRRPIPVHRPSPARPSRRNWTCGRDAPRPGLARTHSSRSPPAATRSPGPAHLYCGATRCGPAACRTRASRNSSAFGKAATRVRLPMSCPATPEMSINADGRAQLQAACVAGCS